MTDFFLVLYCVCMLLSWKEDLCINVCSWIFNSVNMGGENQLGAQNSCVLLLWVCSAELLRANLVPWRGNTWFCWARNAEWDCCGLHCAGRGDTEHLSSVLQNRVHDVWRKEFWSFVLALCVLPGNWKAEEPKAVVWWMCCKSCAAVVSGEGEVDLGTPGKHF